MELKLERRSVSGLHRTENRASGHSHEAYVFQDAAHRRGRISGELFINKNMIAEMGKPVSITICFEKE